MEALPDYRQPDRLLTGLPADVLEAMLALEIQRRLIPTAFYSAEAMKASKTLQLVVRKRGADVQVESVDTFGEPVGDQFPVVSHDGLGSGMP